LLLVLESLILVHVNVYIGVERYVDSSGSSSPLTCLLNVTLTCLDVEIVFDDLSRLDELSRPELLLTVGYDIYSQAGVNMEDLIYFKAKRQISSEVL